MRACDVVARLVRTALGGYQPNGVRGAYGLADVAVDAVSWLDDAGLVVGEQVEHVGRTVLDAVRTAIAFRQFDNGLLHELPP